MIELINYHFNAFWTYLFVTLSSIFTLVLLTYEIKKRFNKGD